MKIIIHLTEDNFIAEDRFQRVKEEKRKFIRERKARNCMVIEGVTGTKMLFQNKGDLSMHKDYGNCKGEENRSSSCQDRRNTHQFAKDRIGLLEGSNHFMKVERHNKI